MIRRPVKRHADFEADYVAQLEWLVQHGERAWILELGRGVRSVGRLLAAFPFAGPVVARRGTIELRKLLFPRGPYLAWYTVDASRPRSEVWLLRLFHARQRRPKPDPRRWLPRSPR